jgi:hypothetical protein
MSTKTTNYDLTKPGIDEAYDIAIPNANMDIIDEAIKAVSNDVSGKADKATTLAGYGIIDAVLKSVLAAVATSGSYADLLNKPTIPAVLSALTNDMNFKSITWETVSIPVASWSSSQATIAAAGMTADTAASSAIVVPEQSSSDAYTAAGIKAVAQGADTLTMECGTTPTVAISVNVMILK